MRGINRQRRIPIVLLLAGLLPLQACGGSSKKLVLPSEPVANSWAVVEGDHAGNILLARVRTQLGDVVRHPAYSFRVGVATRISRVDGNGMPTTEENAALLDVESRLAELLERHRAAIHVVALTTNGVKEWVFYASDPDTVRHRMATFVPTVHTHQLEMVIERDEQWDVYYQFAQDH